MFNIRLFIVSAIILAFSFSFADVCAFAGEKKAKSSSKKTDKRIRKKTEALSCDDTSAVSLKKTKKTAAAGSSDEVFLSADTAEALVNGEKTKKLYFRREMDRRDPHLPQYYGDDSVTVGSKDFLKRDGKDTNKSLVVKKKNVKFQMDYKENTSGAFSNKNYDGGSGNGDLLFNLNKK